MEEIDNFYEFCQWCFRSIWSSLIVLLILNGIKEFILKTIKIRSERLKQQNKTD